MRRLCTGETCRTEGCSTVLGRDNGWGYCPKHVGTALACVMSDEGCTGRVGAWSRSRLCSAHSRATLWWVLEGGKK